MTAYPMPANNVHYWKLRALGVPADVAMWAGRVFVQFTRPAEDRDYVFVAKECVKLPREHVKAMLWGQRLGR